MHTLLCYSGLRTDLILNVISLQTQDTRTYVHIIPRVILSVVTRDYPIQLCFLSSEPLVNTFYALSSQQLARLYYESSK